jgi:hypothetical protein
MTPATRPTVIGTMMGGTQASYRRIGERLGVDPMTAKHDADAGVENSTPSPTVVTGADGKVYPATRPAVVTTNAEVPAGGMRRRPQDRRRGTRWAVEHSKHGRR